MDQHKTITKTKEAPRVPIKTYKWEDIRRERIKGGYPWTYLDKEPFENEADYQQFLIMEQKKLEIEGSLVAPIVEGESTKYVVITELPSDLESHSKIELEQEELNLELDEPEPEVMFTVESAESSDNISQYLDKEDNLPPIASASTSTLEQNRQRAKSEEPKPKRKLSIDSGYSGKSLTKLGILKKLKKAKEKLPKIQIPKLSTNLKQEKKKIEVKEEVKKTSIQAKTEENPVYIHIPLHPPEGQIERPQEVADISPPIVGNGTGLDRRLSGHPDEIVAIEILKTQSIDLDEASKNGLTLDGGQDDIYILQPDPSKPHDDNLIIIMPEDSSSSKADTKSIKSQRSIKSQKSIKSQSSRKGRAKSVEPQSKRKLSIDSSYSHRSLSKLSFMKKIKDAKENIFATFSLSRSLSKQKLKKEVEQVQKVKNIETPKVTNVEPKYIHIPLKPLEGQQDEYSHLENEPVGEVIKTKEMSEQSKTIIEESSIDSPTPTSPKNEDVQFIFLTPPSDDEILDGPPEIPETPSSETNLFEKEELKTIAKGAVDKVSPEKNLKSIEEYKSETEETRIEQLQKIVVDEEDGLAIAKQDSVKEELKSSLKTDSPVLKKKVSFKRRSRDDSKDGGIYEDVRSPEQIKNEEVKSLKSNVLATDQSMSVDEERSYLDEKIMKSTSLEEDFSRWSKLR